MGTLNLALVDSILWLPIVPLPIAPLQNTSLLGVSLMCPSASVRALEAWSRPGLTWASLVFRVSSEGRSAWPPGLVS